LPSLRSKVVSGDLTPKVASGDLTLNVASGDLTPYGVEPPAEIVGATVAAIAGVHHDRIFFT
jgi:hypothetical protein